MQKRTPLALAIMALLLVGASVGSCGKGEKPGAMAAPDVHPVPVKAVTAVTSDLSFDLGAVMRQVHFAFRFEKDGWSGGHSSYTARADLNGVTLAPYQG